MKLKTFITVFVCMMISIGSPVESKGQEIESLIKQFDNKEITIGRKAVERLVQIGQPAVPALIDALNHKNRRIRYHATIALGKIGSPASSAVPMLIKALSDEEIQVRRNAAIALGQIGDPVEEIIPIFIETWRKDNFYINDESFHKVIASAFAEIGQPAVESLIQALRGEDWVIRRHATIALELIGEEASSAVPALIEALSDQDIYVRVNAAFALAQIGSPAKKIVQVLIQTWRKPNFVVLGHHIQRPFHAVVAEALAEMGPPAIPGLMKALSDKDGKVRRYAAITLGLIGESASAAVPALVKALSDEEATVRGSAVKALGQMGLRAETAVQMLIEALNDSDQSVRNSVIDALKKIGTPKAKKALKELGERQN